MFSKKCADTYVLRLEKGEEIVETIKAFCTGENLLCAEVSGIGAVGAATLGFYDVGTKEYSKTVVEGPLEMVSLLGSVTQKDGEPYLHLHASFSGKDCNCIGGHLNSAVISLTGEIFLRKIDGSVGRRAQEETGINILDL
ncbi:MAG: DNA-binding protein [Clostridia bacterium]|nr:DNA-binding protein [Clostridia bacterium]